MKAATEYCKKRVFTGARGDMGGHQCGHKVFKDGLCKIHQPDRIAKRRADLETKWKRESNLRTWAYKREDLERRIVETAKRHQCGDPELAKAVKALEKYEAEHPSNAVADFLRGEDDKQA